MLELRIYLTIEDEVGNVNVTKWEIRGLDSCYVFATMKKVCNLANRM